MKWNRLQQKRRRGRDHSCWKEKKDEVETRIDRVMEAHSNTEAEQEHYLSPIPFPQQNEAK